MSKTTTPNIDNALEQILANPHGRHAGVTLGMLFEALQAVKADIELQDD